MLQLVVPAYNEQDRLPRTLRVCLVLRELVLNPPRLLRCLSVIEDVAGCDTAHGGHPAGEWREARRGVHPAHALPRDSLCMLP